MTTDDFNGAPPGSGDEKKISTSTSYGGVGYPHWEMTGCKARLVVYLSLTFGWSTNKLAEMFEVTVLQIDEILGRRRWRKETAAAFEDCWRTRNDGVAVAAVKTANELSRSAL